MARTEHRSRRRLHARGWGWLFVALTPVAWVFVVLAGFSHEGSDGGGFGAKVAVTLAAAAAPITALGLGVAAARSGSHSSIALPAAAGLLVVATLIGLPLLVT